ncbi:hypothetical protein SDC9_73147 [bioreactor metagenome]|jgi:uncharacterized membrane protein YfcA|uniref:Membrane transporter protein YfcA n=1 Tax=bioreactor metagenome TaxID=1076179 RepID=A0A644YJG8_9ZZZZ|nr:sulfite exporter TauE/SafE family protein [Bacilli bacterium]
MIYLLYAVVMFIASVTGALAGLGGGVIIKQLLDVIGYHNAVEIGFYASVAIFVMGIVAIAKLYRNGFPFDIKIVSLVSIGSLVGGYLGQTAFMTLINSTKEGYVKAIQAVLLAITLILILYYERRKDKIRHYQVKQPLLIFAVGLFLGGFSVFLGIGGGPLNVTLMVLLFSFTIKEAISYSIATVFFSQISKLGSVVLAGELGNYSVTFMIVAGVASVAGGYVGTALNQKLSNKTVSVIFQVLVLLLLFVSFYNTYMGLR